MRAPILTSLSVLALLACLHGAAAAEKPNFLLILADDHGYGDVSAYHESDVRTPNIDRIAAEGMLLTTMRANCTVCSPSRAALLTGRYADPGDVAGTGQPILDIEFFRQIWVSFAVPDDVCSCLHIGHEAEVRFDALPEREFTASIVQINPAADPQTRQFTVRAVLSNDEDLLRPGMFAHVTLVTEQLTQVVAVPREAVQQDEAGDYVTIVDDQDQAQRRAVVLGLSDAQYMSVLEGLEAGEAVVTVAATPVEPGQTVRTGDDEGGGGDGRGNDGPGGGRRGAPGDGPDAASPAEGARAEGGPAAGAQAR